MDRSERKITKIAREVSAITVQTMKAEGIGTAEFDFIHLVRHNPGITQDLHMMRKRRLCNMQIIQQHTSAFLTATK